MTLITPFVISTILPHDAPHAEALKHCVATQPQVPEFIDPKEGVGILADYPGMKATIQHWIAAHGDEKARQAATAVAKSVKFVDYATFTQALIDAYQNIETQLTSLYEPEGFQAQEDVITLVEGAKSNKWVAELALSLCHAEPYSYVRLGEMDARQFVQLLENTSREEFPLLQQQFKDKTIMLFDDASYSGTQMLGHVQAILKAASTFKLKLKAIAIVVPYMTAYAENLFSHIKNPYCPILISNHQVIPSLETMQPITENVPQEEVKQRIAQMWFKGDSTHLQKIGMIWLEHKVPNDQSFPEPLAHGSVYDLTGRSTAKSVSIIPKIISPYKYSEPLPNPSNLHAVKIGKNTFLRGGQPTLADYQRMQLEDGVGTVINLRESQEPDLGELKRLGIKVIHIPFDTKKPTDALVLQFLETLYKESQPMGSKKAPKIFVHCFHGSDRTGMLVAIAQMVFDKVEKNEAIKTMLHPQYGFHRLTHSHLIKYLQEIDVPAIKRQLQVRILEAHTDSAKD